MTPLRLLVVDGYADAADSLALLLRLHGHWAEAAYAGPDALRQATRCRPHVIFTEILLPRMDGYRLARCVRQWMDTTVLVAVTALSQDEHRQRSQEAGFLCHLLKPVDPDTLLEMLSWVTLTTVASHPRA